ncbi:MAG: SGNH/GDSL hydrolase family protein [Clostridia bacterium]|nr:SGNH/GDSL hydrolase family protein [Clostridia bacterium]
MNLSLFLNNELEKPLDNIIDDGGLCSILRTVACVGDSLSSGEFEAFDENGNKSYHDMFEYSWGQFMARMAGIDVYNFSRGGMTAKEYCESFAQANGFWDEDKAAKAYIIALGVNDVYNAGQAVGSLDDVCIEDYNCNADTFAGHYAKIIQRYKEIQPEAKFFLVTKPRDTRDAKCAEAENMSKLLYDLADAFSNTYVIDLRKYAPVYDEKFYDCFFLGGHMSPAGYYLTAKMIASYIDYIIRHNQNDFKKIGFIGYNG